MGRIVYTDPSGQEFSVPLGPEAPVVTIGRATDCTIRSNRKSVSRHHAEFHFRGGRYEVVDLNSSNGTYKVVNDERRPVLGRESIEHADEVWCGDFILRFYDDNVAAGVASGDAFAGGNHYGNHHHDRGYDPGPGYGHGPGNEAPFGGGFGAEPVNFEQYHDDLVDLEEDSVPGSEAPSGGVMFGGQAPRPGYGNNSPSQSGPYGAPAPQPGYGAGGGGGGGGGADVERLRAEKASIEELAARQAFEIEELQSRLNEKNQENARLQDRAREHEQELERLRRETSEQASSVEAYDRLSAEFEVVRGEQLRLQEELEQARKAAEDARRVTELEEQLDEARVRIDDLLERLEKAESSASRARSGELEELREALRLKDDDIAMLERELEIAQEQAADASQAGGDPALEEALAHAREQAEALEQQLEDERHRREQAEGRCRELEADAAEAERLRNRAAGFERQLEEAAARAAELERVVDELRSRLDALTAERDAAIEDARRTREELAAEREGIEAAERDLRSEIEGLKRRLKLEQERARSDEGVSAENARLREELAEFQARIEALQEQIESLEEARQEVEGRLEAAHEKIRYAAGAAMVTPDFLERLDTRVETLDRIVDAIERTDLQPLTTVDRIRLQSAIRDTAPRRTLQEIRQMTREALEEA